MSLANQMRLLRMIAIPFGLLAVVGTYLIARTLFPGSGFVAVTATAFVALQTQISYEAAMINNDILVVGFAAMLIALLLIGMRDRFPWRITIAIGVLFGLMLLSKGTSVVFAGTIALMMITGIGLEELARLVAKRVCDRRDRLSHGLALVYLPLSDLWQLQRIAANQKTSISLDLSAFPSSEPWKLLWNRALRSHAVE